MIATVMSIILDHTVETLIDCDTEPSQVTRHHGTLPDWCCTDAGILSISWDPAVASSRFPSSSENDPVVCAAIPTYTLLLRWVTCWPSEDGTELDYATRDATAARIATVTDCVLRALIELLCSGPAGPLWEYTGPNVRIGRVQPVAPAGGCAGVVWRIVVGVTRSSPAPS